MPRRRPHEAALSPDVGALAPAKRPATATDATRRTCTCALTGAFPLGTFNWGAVTQPSRTRARAYRKSPASLLINNKHVPSRRGETRPTPRRHCEWRKTAPPPFVSVPVHSDTISERLLRRYILITVQRRQSSHSHALYSMRVKGKCSRVTSAAAFTLITDSLLS